MLTHTVSTQGRRLDGTMLKWIACITMLIDHIGCICIETHFRLSGITPPGFLLLVNLFLRIIGRVSFPLFCFLLVEGFLHTHNVRRYLGRLTLFALLSEVPFDLATTGTPFDLQRQNVYWTLALGVVMLCALQRFQTKGGNGWLGIACAAGCVAAAYLLHTDYSGLGLLVILVMYLARNDLKAQVLACAVLFIALGSLEIFGLLAFCFIKKYSGQRGSCSTILKWGFYCFYPLHLLALAYISIL